MTVEEDCDTATCDSCKERRERLALPACFTVQHGDETESITVNCTNGTAVVNVYEYLSGAQASCPIGSGAKLAESSDHVSGQCEVDDHGHQEHGDDARQHDADDAGADNHNDGEDHAQTSSEPQAPDDVFADKEETPVGTDSAPPKTGLRFYLLAMCVFSILMVI